MYHIARCVNARAYDTYRMNYEQRTFASIILSVVSTTDLDDRSVRAPVPFIQKMMFKICVLDSVASLPFKYSGRSCKNLYDTSNATKTHSKPFAVCRA